MPVIRWEIMRWSEISLLTFWINFVLHHFSRVWIYCWASLNLKVQNNFFHSLHIQIIFKKLKCLIVYSYEHPVSHFYDIPQFSFAPPPCWYEIGKSLPNFVTSLSTFLDPFSDCLELSSLHSSCWYTSWEPVHSSHYQCVIPDCATNHWPPLFPTTNHSHCLTYTHISMVFSLNYLQEGSLKRKTKEMWLLTLITSFCLRPW